MVRQVAATIAKTPMPEEIRSSAHPSSRRPEYLSSVATASINVETADETLARTSPKYDTGELEVTRAVGCLTAGTRSAAASSGREPTSGAWWAWAATGTFAVRPAKSSPDRPAAWSVARTG